MSSSSSSPINVDTYTPPHSHGTPCDSGNDIYHGQRYVFTINNPLDHARTMVYSQIGKNISTAISHNNEDNYVAYAIWSLERGSNGTPHIQGYLECHKKIRWQALKNKIRSLNMWTAPAMGKADVNIDYVSHTGKHANKPGSLIEGPWYLGGAPVVKDKGTRTDIINLAEDLKQGKSLRQLATDHTSTMLKYFGNAQKIQTLLSKKKRSWMTELIIYTGVAGSGKSHSAYTEAQQFLADNNIDEEPYMLMIPSNKNAPLWWQDYDGQSVVIIDDFYGTIDLNYFKLLIDKYPMKVNIKNGHAEFLAKRVYVTSNQGWRSWWGTDLLSNRENEAAIMRRITREKHFDTPYGQEQRDDTSAPVRSNAMIGPIPGDWSGLGGQSPISFQARQASQNLNDYEREFLEEEFGDFNL